jgi:hypothetical protein
MKNISWYHCKAPLFSANQTAGIQVGDVDQKWTEQASESIATCRKAPAHQRPPGNHLDSSTRHNRRGHEDKPHCHGPETAEGPTLPKVEVGERRGWRLGCVAPQQLQIAPLPPNRHRLPQGVWVRKLWSPASPPAPRPIGGVMGPMGEASSHSLYPSPSCRLEAV